MFKSALIAVALTGLAAMPATAGSPKREVIGVYYGDLDLNKESGQATLRARLTGAAKAVCSRPGDSNRIMGQRSERKRCIAHALETAYANLGTNGVYAEVK
jgi:UrcA family protein